MNLIKHVYLIFITVLLSINTSQGQGPAVSGNNYPKIGSHCPDFTLNDIHHYRQKQAGLGDFKGKWLVLYFWSRWCTSSISSFPELEKLKAQFKKEANFILVGRDEPVVREIYQAYRKKYGLTLPVAFEKDLADSFGTAGFPRIIFVDPEGVVREISYDITAKGIRNLLNGKKSGLGYSFNKEEKADHKQAFDNTKPFMVEGNAGHADRFIYRSLLTAWEPYMGIIGIHAFGARGRHHNEVLIAGADLAGLYLLAYRNPNRYLLPEGNNDYGDWWHAPVLEVKDTSVFGRAHSDNPKIYTYSLIAPPENAAIESLQQTMQGDLQGYFGYQVRIEKRMMPYYRLTASKEAKEKLRSSGKPKNEHGDGIIRFSIINQPVSRLIKVLWGNNQTGPPFIDETGIDYNIDISLEGILTDFGELKKILAEKGLSVESGKKEMNVVVISDSLH